MMMICCPSSMLGEIGLPLSVGTATFLPSTVTVDDLAIVARLGPVTGIDEVVDDVPVLVVDADVVGVAVVEELAALPPDPQPPTTATDASANEGTSTLENRRKVTASRASGGRGSGRPERQVQPARAWSSSRWAKSCASGGRA